MKRLCLFIMFILPINAFASSKIDIKVREVYNRFESLNFGKILDDNYKTYQSFTCPVYIESTENIDFLYIIFNDEPKNFIVKSKYSEKKYEANFLHYLIDAKEFKSNKLELVFELGTNVSEIYAFNKEYPSWVQKWETNNKYADILLLPTHADDEQLFFAGILPYYAGELKLNVQVAYFTDHTFAPNRRHELLEGLYEVGVRTYPVIGPFTDTYSKDLQKSINDLKKYNFTYEDAVLYQTRLIRKYKPKVVIAHDINGEYGHGQHKLNTASLLDAVVLANDESYDLESIKKYGLWEILKLYIHLYDENKIVFDIDKPLESFDGLTAFEVTKKGFAKHLSQQKTWFNPWLYEHEKASEIEKYSPLYYGLYKSMVGEDKNKNDFMENLTSYHTDDIVSDAYDSFLKINKNQNLVKKSQKNSSLIVASVILISEITSFIYLKIKKFGVN